MSEGEEIEEGRKGKREKKRVGEKDSQGWEREELEESLR